MVRNTLTIVPLAAIVCLSWACVDEALEDGADFETAEGEVRITSTRYTRTYWDSVCAKDSINSDDPSMSVPSVTYCLGGVLEVQEPGAPCRWGSQCTSSMCIPNHEGEGVCASNADDFGSCNQDMGGTWGSIWASGVNAVGSATIQLCTPLDPNVSWPSCAVGFAGAQCQYQEPCVNNDHCASGYCLKEYPESLGACAERTDNVTCDDVITLHIGDGADTVTLCAP